MAMGIVLKPEKQIRIGDNIVIRLETDRRVRLLLEAPKDIIIKVEENDELREKKAHKDNR